MRYRVLLAGEEMCLARVTFLPLCDSTHVVHIFPDVGNDFAFIGKVGCENHHLTAQGSFGLFSFVSLSP